MQTEAVCEWFKKGDSVITALILMGINILMECSDYREKFTLEQRKKDFESVASAHPDMVPIIIVPDKDGVVPLIEHNKFLVPKDSTLQNLYVILRTRLHFEKSQSFRLHFASNKIHQYEKILANIYSEEADLDGFLYIGCTTENYFGCRYMM